MEWGTERQDWGKEKGWWSTNPHDPWRMPAAKGLVTVEKWKQRVRRSPENHFIIHSSIPLETFVLTVGEEVGEFLTEKEAKDTQAEGIEAHSVFLQLRHCCRSWEQEGILTIKKHWLCRLWWVILKHLNIFKVHGGHKWILTWKGLIRFVF